MKIKVEIDGKIKKVRIPYTSIFWYWILGMLGYAFILGIVGLILSFIW